MIHKVTAFIIAVLFLSACGQKVDTEETKSEDIPKGFHKVRINSIKTDFIFPDNYKKYDIYAVLKLSKDSSRQIENRDFLEAILGMFGDNPKMELLLEDGNPMDQVLFKPEDYFQLSKASSSVALGYIQTSLENVFEPMGARVAAEDTKYISSSTTQIVKGRFRIDGDESSLYWTQYFITVGERSFSVLVLNDVGFDFEKEIKMMATY